MSELSSENNQRKIGQNQTHPGKSKDNKEINEMARGGKREGAGRPKGSKGGVRLPSVRPDIKQELRELARGHTDTALETLVRICKTSDNDSARVSAASALLDRGYGKPSQHVDFAISKYDSMSEDELRAHVEAQYQVLRLLEEGNGNGGSIEH